MMALKSRLALGFAFIIAACSDAPSEPMASQPTRVSLSQSNDDYSSLVASPVVSDPETQTTFGYDANTGEFYGRLGNGTQARVEVPDSLKAVVVGLLNQYRLTVASYELAKEFQMKVTFGADSSISPAPCYDGSFNYPCQQLEPMTAPLDPVGASLTSSDVGMITRLPADFGGQVLTIASAGAGSMSSGLEFEAGSVFGDPCRDQASLIGQLRARQRGAADFGAQTFKEVLQAIADDYATTLIRTGEHKITFPAALLVHKQAVLQQNLTGAVEIGVLLAQYQRMGCTMPIFSHPLGSYIDWNKPAYVFVPTLLPVGAAAGNGMLLECVTAEVEVWTAQTGWYSAVKQICKVTSSLHQ